MKIKFILLLLCIINITNAQDVVVVGASGGYQSENNHLKIIKESQVKYKITKIADKAKLLVFSYNIKEKNDFSNGKTQVIQDLISNTNSIIALGIENNYICLVYYISDGSCLSKFNNENKSIKLYPFNIQPIVYNQNIPFAIAVSSKNTISEDILNRVLSNNDIHKINKEDLDYISKNSTNFEIITFCIKTWKK